MKDEATKVEIRRDEPAPVVVNNADIPLLSDVLYIMQEVCAVEQRRDWERDRMYNITSHATGTPGGGGIPHGLDEAFAKLAEIDEEHGQKCQEYVRKLKKAEEILNGIRSESMRTFVLMKYVMNIPETEIRRELNMSRRRMDQARRCIERAENMTAVKWPERYIQKNNFLASKCVEMTSQIW